VVGLQIEVGEERSDRAVIDDEKRITSAIRKTRARRLRNRPRAKNGEAASISPSARKIRRNST
jgi:hypothetical protein